MAKQHIYARGEKGLYSGGAGYDTVQVSKGLNKDFVKKYIYPYCFYQDNKTVGEEKNIMPDVYFMSPIDTVTETLILGRNIYKPGARNSFLSHTVIITEPAELQAICENPDAAVNYDGFLREYGSSELPDIEISKVKIFDMFYTKDMFFELIGITEPIIKSVLYYIIQACNEDKRLYIKLKAEKKIYSEASRQFMRYIFEIIPTKLRKKISYITYSPVLNPPVFFNIVFVDKTVDLTNGLYGYVLDLTKDFYFDNNNMFLKNAWINVYNANKALLKIPQDVNVSSGWEPLDESARSALRFWRNLLSEIKQKLDADNYFYFFSLAIDLSSFGMHDNSLYIMRQCRNSSGFSAKPPDIEEMEYLFGKDLTELYAELAYFDEFAKKLYHDMIQKLNNAEGKFKFFVLARFYLVGVRRYFNREKYSGFNQELDEAVQKGFELEDEATTDYLTKKMQEVIIGEISVYLRKG